MTRLWIPTLPASSCRLDDAASHRLLVVLRQRIGDPLVLFDGQGQEVRATLIAVEDGIALVEPSGSVCAVEPPAPLHLVLGLPRGGATDDALRMATEVGATTIHLVWADRTQGRPDRIDRWTRIAAAAASQCGRADVPSLVGPSSLDHAFENLDGIDLRIALPGAAPLDPPTGPVAVFVGPEGGWSPAEVERIHRAGATPMGLGRWVLRSPTACAIALSACIRTKRGRRD